MTTQATTALKEATVRRSDLISKREQNERKIAELQRERDRAHQQITGSPPLTEKERAEIAALPQGEQYARKTKYQEAARARAVKEEKKLGAHIDRILDDQQPLEAKIADASVEVDAAIQAEDVAVIEAAPKTLPKLARNAERLCEQFKDAYNAAVGALEALESGVDKHESAERRLASAHEREGSHHLRGAKDRIEIHFGELSEVLRYSQLLWRNGSATRKRFK